MIEKKELLKAIAECEKEPLNYQKCEKLANFIIIYNHFYGNNFQQTVENDVEKIIDYYCDTDFSRLIDGKSAFEVWQIMDELMAMTKILHPKVYDSIVHRIEEL